MPQRIEESPRKEAMPFTSPRNNAFPRVLAKRSGCQLASNWSISATRWPA
jgi:hypothetical protein